MTSNSSSKCTKWAFVLPSSALAFGWQTQSLGKWMTTSILRKSWDELNCLDKGEMTLFFLNNGRWSNFVEQMEDDFNIWGKCKTNSIVL
jgi:hypothetical protein